MQTSIYINTNPFLLQLTYFRLDLFSVQLLQKCCRLGCFPVSCCRSALGLADSFSARADLLSAQLIPIRLGLIYFRLGCFHFSCCRNVFGRVNSLSARAEMVSAERIASFLKPKCLFSSAMVFFFTVDVMMIRGSSGIVELQLRAIV